MALTKVSGPLLHGSNDNLGNYVINNITGAAATFTGNVSVGGTLTYDDVTNVESVGIITAKAGIHVGVGGTIIHALSEDDGKVGIGTNIPSRQLEIFNSSHARAALKSDTQSSLFFSDTADDNIGQISYMHSGSPSNYMYFRVNDEERFRITSTGVIQLSNLYSSYTPGTATRFSLYNDTNNHYGLHVGGNYDLNYNAGGSTLSGKGEHRFHTAATERLRIGSTGISTFTNDVRIVKSGGPLLELTTNTGAADATLRLSEGTPGSTTNGGGMFYSGADNKLHITCGTDSTTKRITILRDDGYVGINTTTPSYELVVSPTDINESTLQIKAGGNGKESNVYFGAPDDDDVGKISYDHNGDHMKFVVGTVERFRISSSGNVGISSNNGSPQAMLDIKNVGTSVLPFKAYRNDVGDTPIMHLLAYNNTLGVVDKFVVTSRGRVGVNTDDPQREIHVKPSDNNPATAAPGYIRIEGQGSDQAAILELYHTRGNGSDKWPSSVASVDGGLVLKVANGNNGAPQEKVRITSDGKVGINSISPSNTLVVREQTDNNSSLQLFRESTGGDISSVIWATNQGNQASINYRGGGGSTGMQFYTGGTGSSNLRAIIDTSGRVGINTTSPEGTLDVTSEIGPEPLGAIFRKDYGGSVSDASHKVALTIWGMDHDDLDHTTGTDFYGPMIGFGARNDRSAPNTGDVRAAISYAYNGNLTFHTDAGGSITDGSNERLRIDGATGNIILRNQGHRGGGMYSRTKTVTLSGDNTSSFMRFTLSHGALAGMIFLTGSNSGYSVAKTYAFAAQFGQPVVTNLLADSGAYSGANFSLTSSTSNNQHNFMVQVSGTTQEVNMTVIMGNPNQDLDYVEL